MTGSIKDQILGKADLLTKEIEVDEWEMTIHIKQLSKAQVDAFQKIAMKNTVRVTDDDGSKVEQTVDYSGLDAWVCVRGIVDEEGKRVFANKDESALKEKNPNAIGAIAVAILEHTGLYSKSDEEDDLQDETLKK